MALCVEEGAEKHAFIFSSIFAFLNIDGNTHTGAAM